MQVYVDPTTGRYMKHVLEAPEKAQRKAAIDRIIAQTAIRAEEYMPASEVDTKLLRKAVTREYDKKIKQNIISQLAKEAV